MAVVLSGCKSGTSFPLAKEWKLVELKSKPVPNYVQATLIFEKSPKRFSGNNSCNNYSGTYESDDTTLKFGPAMSTKKYCDAVADWEAAYMNMLTTVDNYVLRDGQLKLFQGTKIVAILKPAL